MKNKRLFTFIIVIAMTLGTSLGNTPFSHLLKCSVFAEEGDSFPTAQLVKVNQDFSDALTDKHKEKYYKFVISKDGYIKVIFNKEYDDSGHNWRMTIFNQYQEELSFNRIWAGDTVPESSCTFGIPSGTYYIKINTDYYDPPTAEYTINVNYHSDNHWEKEINDGFLTANAISLNTKYSASLQQDWDEDYFKANINKTDKYRLWFNRDYCEGADWEIYIYDSTQSEIDRMYVDSGNTKEQYIDLKLKNGINYIRVCSNRSEPPEAIYHFKITSVPQSIIEATVNVAGKKYVYTGKPICPNIVVKLKGKTLKKETDYSVSFKNNKNTGKAIVAIKGKGNYTGTKKVSFIIKPKVVTIKKAFSPKSNQIKVTWKKSAGGVTGHKVMIATNKIFSKNKKTYTVSGTSTISKTITGLKKGTKYFVKVRAYKTVSGTKYYGAWSAVKSVKCK